MQQDFPTIVTQRKVIPNLHPVAEAPYRIAIVGEAPGRDEEDHGYPFVGKSGNLLTGLLKKNGIDRNACFVGNCVQVRPANNDIHTLSPNGPEFRDGLAQLTEDLAKFNPNVTVLLGTTPLHCARDDGKITAWRGSLFRSTKSGPFLGRKCLPSLHPAGILRDFSGYPLLSFDLKRAREEGTTAELVLPQRELITNASGPDLCYLMDTWPEGLRCSIDIEGYHDNWPCVSICSRPTKSWTIAWGRFDEYWHGRVLQSFARLMARRDVPKVLQNQLSDNFKLSWGFGILIRNVKEDTMIKGWEIYAELPRALETQASIYTRQPHWKDDSMYAGDGEGLFRGCALDTAVTLEVCEAQDRMLTGVQRHHYEQMIQLENPFLYMELRGIRYDEANVAARLKETQEKLEPIKARLFNEAKEELWGPKGALVPKRLIKAMYESGKYPTQFKKEKGRLTTSPTTDAEALLSLKRTRPTDQFLSDILEHRHLEGVRETLQITADADGRVRCGYSLEAETGRVKCYTSPTGSGANLQTVQKDLRGNYTADPGHDFCQCDLEGADGWTVAAHAARLGEPTMLDDYYFGLKPAKVTAMLYGFGSDVNKLDRDSLKFWGRKDNFAVLSQNIGEWIYDGCKVVQHGSSYKMGVPTMQSNLMKRSFKETGIPVYMEARDARELQGNFFTRYSGVKLWHQWAEAKLMHDGQLTSASGHTRLFFGRRFGSPGDVEQTVKEFLAHEPQNNTTWATSLAMLKLWNDPANRVRRVIGRIIETCDGARHAIPLEATPFVHRLLPGALLIEPLHQVHDALCVQWLSFLRDWARQRMRYYFDNPLTIAGLKITIPFDGAFGTSWGDCKQAI